ncbi:NGLY1 family protein [Megaselia abdita]
MAPPYDKNLVFLAKYNSLPVYEKCINILRQLLDNIISFPENTKFRSFRIENKIIKELLSANGVEDILYCIGFQKSETEFHLPNTADVKILIQWRHFLDYNFHGNEIEETRFPQSTRSYLERITFPRKLSNPNPFLQNLENLSDHVMQYEDHSLKEYAKKIIPIEELTSKAAEKLFQIQESIANGKTTSKEPCIRDLLLVELSNWFNEDFFQWVNTVECKVCGKVDYSEKSQRFENGNRVEVAFCCGTETKFVRFNDIADLLISRKGRCGEFANCFTFLCRALDYKARWVMSQFDHVWTEVYSENKKRWIHVDPSENVIDSPLMYQHGWQRTVDYVFAFSRDDLQDVTWRYSSDHKATKLLRSKCSEDELSHSIIKIRQKRQSVLTEKERKELSYLTMSELIELLVEREPTENELKGRSSGDLSWKLSRGECSFKNIFVFEPLEEEIKTKQFNVKYSCRLDKYERFLKESNSSTILSTYHSWESCQFASVNIFRKVEKDWKMVYLARNEGTNSGEISWKFDFTKANLIVKHFSLWCDKQTYENGVLNLKIITEGEKTNPIGSSAFIVQATLSGGKGDCSWQHSQLFRQSLSSNEFPFEINLEFE